MNRLRTRRGIGLLAFATVMAIGCVLLGLWQLDRYEQRGERNDAVRSALAEDPVPLETLVGAEGSASAVEGGPSVGDGLEWRSVSVRGTYDDTGTVTLRLRPVEGQSGVHVLTPLVTTDGTTVLVDRGFLPTATRGTEAVDVPPAASGTVEVVGRVRLSEDVAAAGLDPDSSPPSIRFVNLDDLQQVGVLTAGDGSASADAAGDVAPVWLERVEQSPAEDPGLTAIPVPTLSAGTSLIYAVQWFIFGVIAVVGYVLLVRRDRRADAAAGGPGSGVATGGSPAESSETAPSH